MPELIFTTRWPDGRTLQTYSPSLVVHDHLEAGASYPVADLVDRVEAALTEASHRVEARWGHPCTAAQASLATVRRVAAGQPDGLVEVETIDPPAVTS
jgi:uncharacterized repeat protein (TIGR04042 family)